MNFKITIIQTGLTHFRKPFFEDLKYVLERRDINLQIVYGELKEQNLKKNQAELFWGKKINNKTIRVFNTTFIWQNIFKFYHESDLLIILHENKLIANLLLLMYNKISGGRKIALWGHGKNFKTSFHKSFQENVKKWFSKLPNWWFAYNELSKETLILNGVDAKIITVLNNSIDTLKLKKNLDSISKIGIQQIRNNLGVLESTKYIGVFSGSLYKEKRIKFLLDSMTKLKLDIVDVEFIIIGDGPQKKEVQKFCEDNKYCHFVGFQSDLKFAEYLKISDFFLMPGGVGLAILDSFCAGIPIFTTDCGLHGPEIAYLKNGYNGFISNNDINSYTKSISLVVFNTDNLLKLKENSLKSASNYSIRKMAENFERGIISFLYEYKREKI